MNAGINAWIDYCFADEAELRPYHLHNFIKLYGEDAGRIRVNLCIESQEEVNDTLVIELNAGFHCLHIPMKLIDQLIATKEEGT